MKRNFENFLDAFMKHSKYVGAPPAYIKWSAISIIAAALGRKVWIKIYENHVYPNMYIMLTGPSGCRKSTSIKKASFLIKQVPKINFMADKVTEASLIEQMSRASTRTPVQIGKRMYQTGTLFINAGEAANTLKEVKGNIVVALTDFYDCGFSGWHSNIAWTKELVSKGEIKVYNPCVNMLACSNQTFMKEFISEKEIGGGFASRILFIVNDAGNKFVSAVEMDENSKEVEELELMSDKLIEDLETMSQMTGQFSTDRKMLVAADEFNKETELFKEENPNHLLSGYYNRRVFHAIKLSQIISAIESNDMRVTLSHFQEAKKFLLDIEPRMAEAFNYAQGNEFAPMAEQIYDFVKNSPKGVVRSELISEFWGKCDPQSVNICLSGLLEMKRISKTEKKGTITYSTVE